MPSQTLRKLASLTPRDWLTMGEIVFAGLVVEAGLRFVPFHRFLHFMTQPPTRLPRSSTPPEASAIRLSRFATALFRRAPLRLTCLRQSLILLALLRRRGYAPDLKIGVDRSDRGLRAHAWLEYRGHALTDHEDPCSFQAVLSLAWSGL